MALRIALYRALNPAGTTHFDRTLSAHYAHIVVVAVSLLSPSDLVRSFVHYQELHRQLHILVFAFVNYCARSHMLTH